MLSVLLPVYNASKYVNFSIESILRSSFKNFELIVINDGSTDSSLSVINKYKDSRLKVFNKQNSGLIDTLNYGLQKCNFPIIMRMDADDIISSKKIENQLRYFKNNKSVLTGTTGYLIDSIGNKKGLIDLPLNHNEIIKAMLNMSASFIHPSVMYYKDAVIKVGGYDSNFKHAEDYDLFLKLSSLGKVSNLDERHIYLRKHDENISFLNAEDQINNTIISRDIYKLSKGYKYKHINYEVCKTSIHNNNLKSLFIFLHTSIVELNNLTSTYSKIKLFIFKVLRIILKKLI
jgi:glycosyltransferase involved in cell wall biosynthesis